jgi:hypothetical protein
VFATNEEFYAYIDKLIGSLDEAGEREWAAALRDAKANGSTGNEVQGNLLLALKKLQASKAPRRLGMQGELRAVIADLARALRRWR